MSVCYFALTDHSSSLKGLMRVQFSQFLPFVCRLCGLDSFSAPVRTKSIAPLLVKSNCTKLYCCTKGADRCKCPFEFQTWTWFRSFICQGSGGFSASFASVGCSEAFHQLSQRFYMSFQLLAMTAATICMAPSTMGMLLTVCFILIATRKLIHSPLIRNPLTLPKSTTCLYHACWLSRAPYQSLLCFSLS